MAFATEITINDHKDFMRTCGALSHGGVHFWVVHFILLVGAIFVIGAMFLLVSNLLNVWQSGHVSEILDFPYIPIILAVLPVAFVIAILWIVHVFKILIRAPANAKADSINESALRNGLDLGPIRFELLRDGLQISMSLVERRYLWSAFQEIQESTQNLFLMFDDMSGVILPKRAFPDDRAVQDFKSTVKREIGSVA